LRGEIGRKNSFVFTRKVLFVTARFRRNLHTLWSLWREGGGVPHEIYKSPPWNPWRGRGE
jgi:hypothetical protein